MYKEVLSDISKRETETLYALIYGVAFLYNRGERKYGGKSPVYFHKGTYWVFSHEGDEIGEFSPIEVESLLAKLKKRRIIAGREHNIDHIGLTLGWATYQNGNSTKEIHWYTQEMNNVYGWLEPDMWWAW